MAKLHIWHRYLGITVSLFVIVLSVTGVLLNYTDALKLTDSHISNSWLLNHYNIGDFPVTTYKSQSKHISQASDYVYLNGEYALHLKESLVGVITINTDIVLATESSLIVINDQNEVIDEIDSYTGLPEDPLGISITESGNPVIRGVNTYWGGSKSLSAWQPFKGPHPQWVAPIDTPDDINVSVQTHARGNEINFERVILDLHSGRLLGSWGQNIMSIAAVLLIVLAVTGIIMWLKKKPS